MQVGEERPHGELVCLKGPRAAAGDSQGEAKLVDQGVPVGERLDLDLLAHCLSLLLERITFRYAA